MGGNLNWFFDWTGKTGGNANLSVKLTMPILDADSARLQQEESGNQIALFILQKDQMQKSIATDIQDAFESMELASRKLEVAELNAENTKTLADLMKVQVEHGTATNQDYMTTTVNAANAAAAFAGAKVDVQLAILHLQSVMGY